MLDVVFIRATFNAKISKYAYVNTIKLIFLIPPIVTLPYLNWPNVT